MDFNAQKIRSYSWVLLVSLLVATACSKKTEPVPTVSTLLSEEKLVLVLADIHEAEAMINSEFKIEKRDSLANALLSTVYAIHKVTPADVDSSLNAYLREPRATEVLYEKIAARLSLQESEFQSRAAIPTVNQPNPISNPQPPSLPSAK